MSPSGYSRITSQKNITPSLFLLFMFFGQYRCLSECGYIAYSRREYHNIFNPGEVYTQMRFGMQRVRVTYFDKTSDRDPERITEETLGLAKRRGDEIGLHVS